MECSDQTGSWRKSGGAWHPPSTHPGCNALQAPLYKNIKKHIFKKCTFCPLQKYVHLLKVNLGRLKYLSCRECTSFSSTGGSPEQHLLQEGDFTASITIMPFIWISEHRSTCTKNYGWCHGWAILKIPVPWLSCWSNGFNAFWRTDPEDEEPDFILTFLPLQSVRKQWSQGQP